MIYCEQVLELQFYPRLPLGERALYRLVGRFGLSFFSGLCHFAAGPRFHPSVLGGLKYLDAVVVEFCYVRLDF